MHIAAHQGRLGAPDNSGVTPRAHLEGLLNGHRQLSAQKRAAVEAELAGPEFPEALGYLWDRFLVLNGMRSEGMHGMAAFTPEMLDAADRLFQWDLSPLEVEGFRALDVAFRFPATVEEVH